MTITRLMLKITALSFVIVAAVCTIIAYWDKIVELTAKRKSAMVDHMAVSDYDDYEE